MNRCFCGGRFNDRSDFGAVNYCGGGCFCGCVLVYSDDGSSEQALKGDAEVIDPVSVLLIIGAAVVGPIDGKRVCTDFGTGTGIACRSDETVDQLCKRAMWEVGARPGISMTLREVKAGRHPITEDMISDGPREEWRILGKDVIPSWWQFWRRAYIEDSVQVFCIPTPAGYRR